MEHRRVLALKPLVQGHQPFEVARLVAVDRRSVRLWNRVYREAGQEGLRAKPAPGRPPKLEARTKKRLEQALFRGAKSAGFPTILWARPRVAQLIRDRFGVSYPRIICRTPPARPRLEPPRAPPPSGGEGRVRDPTLGERGVAVRLSSLSGRAPTRNSPSSPPCASPLTAIGSTGISASIPKATPPCPS